MYITRRSFRSLHQTHLWKDVCVQWINHFQRWWSSVSTLAEDKWGLSTIVDPQLFNVQPKKSLRRGDHWSTDGDIVCYSRSGRSWFETIESAAPSFSPPRDEIRIDHSHQQTDVCSPAKRNLSSTYRCQAWLDTNGRERERERERVVLPCFIDARVQNDQDDDDDVDEDIEMFNASEREKEREREKKRKGEVQCRYRPIR